MNTENRFFKLATVCFLLTTLFGCQKKSDKRFELMPSNHTGVHFRNVLTETPEMNIFNYLYFYDGGGVAAGDLNGDGLPDLYFTSNQDSNRLYLNKGNFQFEDITIISNVAGQKGWTTGVTMADVNGDGRLDIYVSQLGDFKNIRGRNQLYVNMGNNQDGVPIFENQAKEWGLDLKCLATQAAFFDYDLDGDLDMYMLNHSVHALGTFVRAETRKEKHPLAGDKLMRNDTPLSPLEGGEKGVFVDVTDEGGIYSSVLGYGLGISIGDINWDGYPDIYVGNDFHEDDYLYINNGDGTFTEQLGQYIEHTSKSSMGNDIGDFNNDGFQDIISLDMLPGDPVLLKTAEGEDPFDIYHYKLNYGYKHQLARNTLQLNYGNGKFGEIALMAGIHATDWSWSCFFADLDLDGYKDIFISNGIKRRSNDMDYISFISTEAIQHRLQGDLTGEELKLVEKMPEVKVSNYAFHNNRNLTFSNVAAEWGLGQNSFSNGTVYADLDDDGDLDLIMNNVEDEAFIYQNKTISKSSKQNRFLKLVFKGEGMNKFGIGTKVNIPNTDKGMITYELFTTRGFQSSVSPELVIGLGDILLVDSLFVIWPDHSFQLLKDIKTNQKLVVEQKNAKGQFDFKRADHSLFSEYKEDLGIIYQHEENKFIEFNREALIPHMTSTEGPSLSVGDVNGDGLNDFFIGGAKRQPGELYLQISMGFEKSSQKDMAKDRLNEDTGSLFLDIDNDRDLDLLVASGGNEFRLSDDASLLRLYENDGNGNFTRDRVNLPDIYIMGSCIKSTDLNADGFPDVFIGGRTVPRNYGEIPQSYLLLNDGKGKLEDKTIEIGGEGLSLVGMVKDAIWTDVDNDNDDDLIVVGEWMPVIIFINENGKLTNNKHIHKSNGWWNAIMVDDVDKDGDRDLITGNLGVNSKLHASENQPLEMYVKDFDQNGVMDQLILYHFDGKKYLFPTRDELVKQIRGIENKIPTYWGYASASAKDLFSDKELKEASKYEVFEFRSGVFINNGELDFEFIPFPMLAQVSPVNSILLLKSETGKNDLLLTGNFYDVNIQRGRYDANNGIFLKNLGQGQYEPFFNNLSGLKIDGQVRDTEKIIYNGQELILIAVNNDKIKVIKKNR